MGFWYRSVLRTAFFFVRVLLKLRYRIEVKGLENILSLSTSQTGVLFLPNHPAEIDPVILLSILGPRFFPKSIIVERFYRAKGFQTILDFARVVPIPCFQENPSRRKRKKGEKVFATIGKELQEGENYLIYPAGKLKRSGDERIGGASLVYNLVTASSHVPVVLIRTSGLWGSSFSVYGKERSPDFGSILWQGVRALIRNGIFFLPKRRVTVEIEQRSDLASFPDRTTFNRYLESWYNRYPEGAMEKPVFVSYGRFEPLQNRNEVEPDTNREEYRIDPVKKREILQYIAKLAKTSPDSIGEHASLGSDLGLDSLDLADIRAFLDKRYEIDPDTFSSWVTPEDIFRTVAGGKGKKAPSSRIEAPSWVSRFMSGRRSPLAFSESYDIVFSFLDGCDRRKGEIACADRISGVFTYRKMKVLVLLLAKQFASLPGERIGVLLPSSVSAYGIVLALLLSGKIPVMLNWTTGRAGLDRALQIGEVTVTLSSERFLDSLSLEDLGAVEDSLFFLEDLKERISFLDKAKAYLLGFFSARTLCKRFSVPNDPDRPAVLLFTGGTESDPKGVLLSHRNIVSTQKGAMSLTNLSENDILYGVLPPFHSFGFSITGLFPLLAGLRVLYAPDPTDGYAMGADIEATGVTVLCLAPSFIEKLLQVTSPERLRSLRLIVSGAEKPSLSLLESIRRDFSFVTWTEGYGITECSPVVTLQPWGEEARGVGKLLPGTSAITVDPVTKELLESGREGELCFSGPGIFSGYVQKGADPFFFEGGKKWYRSGDIGRVDSEGNLYLTGRLKRTIKIGGEMISLSGIEELLFRSKEELFRRASLFPPSNESVRFVILESPPERGELVLVTDVDVSASVVNQVLRESGASRLVKISRVIVSQIPLMGTGKIDYRGLEEEIGKRFPSE